MNLAKQTKNFLSSFRLAAEGWGEEPCKEMEGSFWVCRAALPRAEARISASEKPLSLILEPMGGIEPPTSPLPWVCSTN
jgi:hypothetical protein